PAYPRGQGVVEGAHNANVRVIRNGETIGAWREISGEQTPAQRALGFPRGSQSSHTEQKGLTRVAPPESDTVIFTGQSRPCSICRGAMNDAAAESGATILYRWRQNGETWVWQAQRGLIQKGAVRAEPGRTLRW